MALKRNVVTLGIIALVLAANLAARECRGQEAGPWWDDYPLFMKYPGDVDIAVRMNASVVLSGVADDPSWGIYGQRLRMMGTGGVAQEFHERGIKVLTWIEAFGTTHCYVAQVKKDAEGGWVKTEQDPTVTSVPWQHWGWHGYDGTGLIRWVGSKNYFDDEDFARPYTRTHPRYGGAPMTYPDGTVASGYTGAETDPRNSRVYDAGCSKNVLGKVDWSCRFNATVNTVDPETGLPKGPTKGLMEVDGKYASIMLPGKDAACPAWIDSVRGSILQAIDAGVDGLWVDNFSPFDCFSQRPVLRGFGEWSVATFRTYLARRFSPEELRRFGVSDVESFNVRTFLRDKCAAWGGTPSDLWGGGWHGARWLDDPIWRAYLIHKRQNGTEALESFYRTIKETAAANGKPDFLVSGNDIPAFALGWPRGELDMVSTELGWGWSLAGGPRGFMPPPLGSYVPVYKLAREHAKGRFVNVWMYAPREYSGKPGIASVLYYQGLANDTFPLPSPGSSHFIGDDESSTEFFRFVKGAKSTFGDRRPVEEIGVYFSSSSQLTSIAPGGFLDFKNQSHVFAHWGWGTALVWLHHQYRAVPEWKLTRETLDGLHVMIIPNATVFPPEDVDVLTGWIRDGGRLIVTGKSGIRAGESQNFDKLALPSLAELTGVEDYAAAPPRRRRAVGQGRVLYLREPIGLAFFKADEARRSMLSAFAEAVTDVAGSRRFAISNAGDVPPTVGLAVHADKKARRLFIDVHNTDIDLASDKITPSPPVSFTVVLPEWLRGEKLALQILSPEDGPSAEMSPRSEAEVRITLSPIELFAAVVIGAVR